jgi:hypothetical protein
MGIDRLIVYNGGDAPESPESPWTFILGFLGIMFVIGLIIAILPYLLAVGVITGATYWTLQRKVTKLKIFQFRLKTLRSAVSKANTALAETREIVSHLPKKDQDIAIGAAQERLDATLKAFTAHQKRAVALLTEIKAGLEEARTRILKKASAKSSARLDKALGKTDIAIERVTSVIKAMEEADPIAEQEN